MSASQHPHIQAREMHLRPLSQPPRRLDEHIFRALNKIKRPSSAEEIAELLNEDLGPGDSPFGVHEIESWLRRSGDNVMTLYWLGNRPRR